MSEILSGSSGVRWNFSFQGGTILANISSFENTTPVNLVAYRVGFFGGSLSDNSWTSL